MRDWNKYQIRLQNIPKQVFTLPMRDWNPRAWHRNLTPCAGFLPYLWGIETGGPGRLRTQSGRFLPYLWGIETRTKLSGWTDNMTFLPYLWGIETACEPAAVFDTESVFTLPMRDWNWCHIRPYPTRSVVFTLPMRDWNSAHTATPANGTTSFYFTYEGLRRGKRYW